MSEQSQPLLDFAASLVADTRTLVDDLEVWIARDDSHSFRVENQSISPRLSGTKIRLGLRVLKDGAIGYGALMSLDREQALNTVRRALKATRPTVIDRFGPCQKGTGPDVACPVLGSLAKRPVELYELASRLRDRTYTEAGAKIESFNAQVTITHGSMALATQQGQCAFSRAALMAVANVDSIMSEHYWTTAGEPDRERLSSLGVDAVRALQRPRVSPDELGCRGQVEAVLHPRLVEGLLRTLGNEKFSGSAHLAGLSELEPGQHVANESITLHDDASNPSGFLGRPVDDEGTACRRHVLIDKGQFTGFLYSRATARRAGAQPTGHGYRRPILTEDVHEAPVRERMSALYLESGETPLNRLIGGIETGMLVHDLLGLHTANQAQASFSCAVLCGFSIEQGRIARVLAPGSYNLSGSLLDRDGIAGLLSTAVPSKERIHTGSADMPYLKAVLTV